MFWRQRHNPTNAHARALNRLVTDTRSFEPKFRQIVTFVERRRGRTRKARVTAAPYGTRGKRRPTSLEHTERIS